jgi:hypothetical protein
MKLNRNKLSARNNRFGVHAGKPVHEILDPAPRIHHIAAIKKRQQRLQERRINQVVVVERDKPVGVSVRSKAVTYRRWSFAGRVDTD